MSPFDILAYQRDVLERSILFFDTLRKRANAMLEHEQAGLPALLNFKSEMILDARQFEQPANYALLRITEVGDKCWDDCVDPTKSPVIVIDPRAGHGPGIGGFKRDSEVGIALHVGHPVYFVIFFAEPCPGQTLADVLAALRRFVEHVAKLHPGHPPILYGNCQAGWAATLVSAHCGDLAGPVILNGSPLSYWAGEPGVNPMRVTAGLVGGVWLTHFLADLGHRTIRRCLAGTRLRDSEARQRVVGEVRHALHAHRHRAAAVPGLRALVERFLSPERRGNGGHRRESVRRQPA